MENIFHHTKCYNCETICECKMSTEDAAGVTEVAKHDNGTQNHKYKLEHHTRGSKTEIMTLVKKNVLINKRHYSLNIVPRFLFSLLTSFFGRTWTNIQGLFEGLSWRHKNNSSCSALCHRINATLGGGSFINLHFRLDDLSDDSSWVGSICTIVSASQSLNLDYIDLYEKRLCWPISREVIYNPVLP